MMEAETATAETGLAPLALKAGRPAVSVIIPTYNRAHCLRRAVDSVLGQTFSDFELIVVDDGSTDGTMALLESIDDPRLRILHHGTNRGVGAAINTGIRSAEATLIAIQDSDDEWLPEKLARQVAAMMADDRLGVVFCDQWRYRGASREYFASPRLTPDDGIIYHRALDDALHNIGNQSLLIRRQCFEKVGLYDEQLPKNEDLDMLVRISKYYLFLNLCEPLLNYYVTEGSVTARGEAAGIRTQERLFEKYQPDLKRLPSLLAKRAYWIGSFNMRAGDTAKGRSFLWRAVLARPTNLRYLATALVSLFGASAYRLLYRLTK